MGSHRMLPTAMQHRLRMALRAAEEPEEDELAQVYRRASAKVHDRLKRELSLPSGTMFVLPSAEPERVYIAGKSGVGKSTICSMYMNEYHRMHPDRMIYLISRHEDDPAYRAVPHEMIPLEMFEGKEAPRGHGTKKNAPEPPPAIELENLENSLVVFDDMDNCPSKAIEAAIQRLCNSIISAGRKFGIHCCWLNHQLTDWSRTRNLLMEANKVVLFPSGDNYHIGQYLKRYAGLGRETINKITGLRSRWVMLATTVPSYVVHEHGAFVL
jgi:hypothetical protein